jgi:putative hemolysin
VHPAYRTGPVIMQLWAGLAQYMVQEGYEHVIGCASVSMNDGGAQAASLYRALLKNGLAEHQYRVFPRQPVRFERLSAQCDIAPPPLIRGYLRLGAKVCGEPAFDADFNSADFFMLLSLASMNPRYARHFGVRSAS